MNDWHVCPSCHTRFRQAGPAGNCPNCLFALAEAIAREPTSRSAGLETDVSHKELSITHANEGASQRVLHYFGDYELIEEIARGGMGVVYRARQVSLNRIVAVKVLLFGQFASDEFVQRFRAEAESAASLHHPNIVAIHEVGEHEGRQYFSMDYVAGGHLGELVCGQPLPARRAATLLRTIAEAVHHAHQHGVLHRDLKPSNVLLDSGGEPYLTDFGLAKHLTTGTEPGSSNLTITGQMLGTPNYVSPEQAGGRRASVTAASDIYSLGAILYFLLTGRPPFLAENLEQTLERVLHDEPISPRLLNPAVPRDLETLCLKCLSKEPSQRYASAQELAEELGRWLCSEPIRARPTRAPEKLWRWCVRKPALAAALVALNIVGAAGLVGILWQWSRAEQNARTVQRHATSETAQRLRAEEALTLLELQRAEDLLEKDEVVMGVAYLARMVRHQPTNRIAAQRLLSALAQRNFAIPVGEPMRHNKRIYFAEFSPNGRSVVTASLDLTARIWDARTGRLLFTLPHPAAVRSARFSPDGSRILTGSDDFVVRLWDAHTGRPLGRPMIHPKKVHRESVTFSPDGRRILTGSDDGTARVWDGHTGEPMLKPLVHQGPVIWVRFAADGRRIVTASFDQTVQLWDALTGQATGPALQHSGYLSHAAISADGRRLVTVTRNLTSLVWELPSGTPMSKPMNHSAHVGLIGFSPEGERVVTETGLGIIQAWNARDWTPITRPMLHRANTWAAEFSPEGQRILTGSMDATARVWDASTGEPLTAAFEHDDMVTTARFSPDGAFGITASADQTARIWDLRLGEMRSPLLTEASREFPTTKTRSLLSKVDQDTMDQLTHWIGSSFSPDGEHLITAGSETTAELWNMRTFQPELIWSNTGPSVQMRFSPDGKQVAIASVDGVIRLWRGRDGQQISRAMKLPASVGDLGFSPDGQWLAAVGSDNTVRQWNVSTGEPRGEPIILRRRVQFFCYSPDGQGLLASDFEDDIAWLYEASSGRLIGHTPTREGRVLHADFSPDGRIITASEDGTARIWNGLTLQPLLEPLRHKGVVLWSRFSHDGHSVATASESGTARLWNAKTGEPIGEPMNHRAPVWTIEFSPDDLLVVTASQNGAARLWDAKTGRAVSESFTYKGNYLSARFSPDGHRVLAISDSDGPRVWDVPPALGTNSAFAAVLVDLAEAVIGKRVNGQGAVESVASDRLAQIRQRVADLPRDGDFTRWMEWFLADRSTRTISPYSAVTVPRYVEQCSASTNFQSWHEGLLLNPMDSANYLRLAENWRGAAKRGVPGAEVYAEWASRQAMKFASQHTPP